MSTIPAAVLKMAHAVNGCRPVDSAMPIPHRKSRFDNCRNPVIASELPKQTLLTPTMAMRLQYIGLTDRQFYVAKR